MKRIGLIAFLLLCCASWAQAGTCPSSSAYHNYQAGTTGTLNTLWSVTTCFYADYVNGADTATGADETHPWKNIPGMQACVNNCGSNTPACGSGYILRGGINWAVAAFPDYWIWSGSSGCYIYIGFDPTWFSGGSFSRPIMNAGSTAITSGQGSTFFQIGPGGVGPSSFVVLDNLEMTSLYWDATVTTTVSCASLNNSTNIVIQDPYCHSWSHAASGTSDVFQAFVGNANSPYNVGDELSYCLIDGSPSGTDSGYGIYELFADHCIIRNLSNGYLPNRSAVSDGGGGIIGPVNPSFSGVHENCVEPVNGGTNVIFNWYLFNCTSETILAPGTGSPETDYFYNIVAYNSGLNSNFGFPFAWDNYTPSSGLSQYLWASTLVEGNTANNVCVNQGTRGGTSAVLVLSMVDNACYNTSFFSVGAGATTLTNSNNTVMSLANAGSSGMSYTQSLPFSPTSSNCGGFTACPVAAGTQICGVIQACTGNFTALAKTIPPPCTVDGTNHVICNESVAVVRNSTPDAGAYQFSGSPPPSTNTAPCTACFVGQPAPPTNLKATIASVPTSKKESVEGSGAGRTLSSVTDMPSPIFAAIGSGAFAKLDGRKSWAQISVAHE